MEDGMLKFKGGWYIPCMGKLKKLILDEFHKIPYFGHQKMLKTMKKISYWPCIKKKHN